MNVDATEPPTKIFSPPSLFAEMVAFYNELLCNTIGLHVISRSDTSMSFGWTEGEYVLQCVPLERFSTEECIIYAPDGVDEIAQALKNMNVELRKSTEMMIEDLYVKDPAGNLCHFWFPYM